MVGVSANTSHAFLWQNGTMTDLGTLPGDDSSIPAAINGVGQVAGISFIGSSLHYRGFIWQNGVMTDLGTLAGMDVSFITGLNDRGQVVGDLQEPNGGAYHAFVWQNGAMTDLGNLGGASSYPNAINNVGQIVGFSDTSSGSMQAFLWENNTMTALGTLPGIDWSIAYAINDVGQIVGSINDVCTSSGYCPSHAILWQNGTVTDLGAGDGYGAYAINDLGQVAGWRIENGATLHAFVWQNGTIIDLDPVSGWDSSFAYKINRFGRVVGVSQSASGNTGRATLWTITTHNTPVGSFVPVSPVLGVTMQFPAVTIAGDTTATGDATPPPSGSTVDGSVWDISTTATYIGPVTICLPYHSAINPNPRLYHYVRGAWVDITTGFVPATQVVCGTAMSFSPFAVLVPSAVPFASFTARVEITRSHVITKHAADSFEIEGRGVLNAASNGIAPNVENVTVKLGPLSLTIPAGSFVKKADKDDDHGKNDDEHGKMDRDDRITTYNFKGVIAGVLLSAEIEQGPNHTFRFQFEGHQASFGLVSNPVTVGLAIGDDVGQVVVKADIDKK